MSVVRLGSNIASLAAQRRLAETTSSLSKTFERLSSGQRINRASDDAAGLAIADSLRADSRIFNQGVRNLNDGLSLLNIADSAIENLSTIMIRLEELAEQAANGTYGAQQRKAIDAEAQALSKEFFRISKATEFNGRRLLAGDFDKVHLQAGVGTNAVLSAGVGGAIGTGTFGTRNTYSLGGALYVVNADFNGDGHTDLVATDAGSLRVLIGTGNGTFATGMSFATSGNPVSVITQDFNGDGFLDLANPNYLAGGIMDVHLGNGDGTFATRRTYALGPLPFHLASADLNGDGVPDLVAANIGGTTLSVFHGKGDGTFNFALTYTSGPTPSNIILQDFNLDGLNDIAYIRTGVLEIAIGNGSGFSSPVGYADSTFVNGLTSGDLNGDGKPDIVTTDSFNGSIGVFIGNGDGTFAARASYGTGAIPYQVIAADLNGDGFLDLVNADGTANTFSVLLGVGNGTFGSRVSYSSGSNTRSVTAGDFNGDGVFDVATAEYSTSTVGVRLGGTKDGVAPLLPFSLKTMADARQALPVFKRKREQLAAQRGQIGAFQSRIGVAVNVLQVTSENFKAAESRIRDADIATESSQLVRLNILQQAASAVLAQANQQPALALRLLSAT